MRYFLILTSILFLSINTQSTTIEIQEIEETNRDFVFSLKNNSLETSIILDCASFFHNLDINGPDYKNDEFSFSDCSIETLTSFILI